MRRIGRMLCLLLFMLWQGGESVAAEEEGTLEDLLRRAAATPAVDTYSAVCRFCYADGAHPAVLSANADSLRQLGVRTRSARCFLEYYAWKSEARFQQADYQKGYALKRSAIAWPSGWETVTGWRSRLPTWPIISILMLSMIQPAII